MAGCIENFFFAWGAPDDRRDTIVKEAVSETVVYTDPRGTVEGADALCAYVAQYSANAPGAAAEVAEQSTKGDLHKVRVRFHGDGWEQFGTYDVRLDAADRIAEITGVADKSA